MVATIIKIAVMVSTMDFGTPVFCCIPNAPERSTARKNADERGCNHIVLNYQGSQHSVCSQVRGKVIQEVSVCTQHLDTACQAANGAAEHHGTDKHLLPD